MSYEAKAANEYAPPTYSNNGSSQMSQPYNNAPHTPIQPDVAYHNTGASPPHQQTPYGAPASPAAQPAGGYYGAPQPVHSDSYTKSEGNYPQGAGGMPQYQQQGHPQHPQQAHQPQYPQHHGSMGAPGQGGQQQQYSTLTPIPALTSAPAPVRCPACNATTMTRTQMTTGNTTHAWAAGLCIALCLGCIPYCISGTKDVEQKCGNCGVLLATWHRSGRTEVHMHS